MNEAQNYLRWNILTKQGAEFPFAFSLFLNSPVVRIGPESSSIKAEVNFVNSSFIISTVTFANSMGPVLPVMKRQLFLQFHQVQVQLIV